jgi:hypothetical protein
MMQKTLNLKLDEGVFWKLVSIWVLVLFNYVVFQDYNYFLDKGYYWAFFIVVPLIYLVYIFFKVIFVAKGVHFVAEKNSLQWSIFENEKLIERVVIDKNDIKEFHTYLNVSNRYVSSSFLFTLKDGSTKELRDDLLYSFEPHYEVIKSFLEGWYAKDV